MNEELHKIKLSLDQFATSKGFEPEHPFYITGNFNIKRLGANALYSDEAHLWCERCANKLLAKAHALMPADKRADHIVCAADVSTGEDSPSACRDCGVSLDHFLTETGFDEEIYHYEKHKPHKVTPNEAWCISRILWAAYSAEQEAAALTLGRLALAETEKA